MPQMLTVLNVYVSFVCCCLNISGSLEKCSEALCGTKHLPAEALLTFVIKK